MTARKASQFARIMLATAIFVAMQSPSIEATTVTSTTLPLDESEANTPATPNATGNNPRSPGNREMRDKFRLSERR